MFKNLTATRICFLAIGLSCALLSTSVFAQAAVQTEAQPKAQASTQTELPENVPGLLAKANEAYVAKDYEVFRDAMVKLNELRPNNSNYMYQLVIAYALMDEKRQAYDMMVRMQKQGLAYDFSTTDNTSNIQGTEVFDYINDLMKMAADPMGEATVAFALPEAVKLPETITWDETRQKFLIGTVAEGSVLAVDMDGNVEELFKATETNGLWSVFDILVDVPRNRLWVTSAASPKFLHFNPADKGHSALFEYNLETLEPVAIYPVPVDGNAHSLGSMVMNPTGDIFIVDRVLPIVYKKPAAEPKLSPLLASREMVSMRGIAMQPDGSIMYVADRELGILVVDVKGGRAGKLVVPETLNVGGIDGLYLWENQLVIIQNGLQPQRVMRLALDASGTKVESVRPLAVAQEDFDFPSYGVLKDNSLYYFDRSQWLDDSEQMKAVKVLRTPVDTVGELEQPDMTDYLAARAKMQEEQRLKQTTDN